MRKLRRLFVGVVLTGVLLAVLLTFVFPTRTFVAQRTAISGAERQLEVLQQQNGELEARAARLRDDAEIERIAREQYNLVRPGEEAYAILPAPGGAEAPTATTVPAAGAAHDSDGLLERVWHRITSLL
jgi:cell division protein FtsB